MSSTPKNIVGAVFRETICMGSTYLSPQQIRDVVHNLRLSFTDSNYNMVTQCVRVDSVMNSNCNHFSNEFCKIIVGKEIPSYINRCASIAGHFPSLTTSIAQRLSTLHPSRVRAGRFSMCILFVFECVFCLFSSVFCLFLSVSCLIPIALFAYP